MHGSTLERCVCEALEKEGSCSLTAEHHNTPRILGFHGTSGLVQGVRRRAPSFSFFLSSSGTRLRIHRRHWLCQGFCLGVQGLLSAVTSGPPPPLDRFSIGTGEGSPH